jgi:tetratricopeptide (TPR) repeat protein
MPCRRFLNLGFSLLALSSCVSLAQTSESKVPKTTNSAQIGQHALELAKSGRCGEAIPLLKKAIAQSNDKTFQHSAGLAGVRCAMVSNEFGAADDFLRTLYREFPNDPEVLYTAVHTYSDLATHASQDLAIKAPNSAQAHELNAESLEMQGKWDQAEKEYQKVLQQNPQMPGIHFRIGRLLLSKPNPAADVADQAKKEFQQELAIDPSNAGAEYVLGELARESQQWDDAVAHFSRAAKLDSSFGDAYVGLGAALISTKKFSDAVAPLEMAVKLEPENPAAHYNLAIAYTRTGRKQEGEHEFAIHRQMVQKNPPAQSEAQPQGQPANAPQ